MEFVIPWVVPFDPSGNATSVSETVPNPFRLTGAIWDASTGLYQMGERYYDPSTGQFMQQDPAGGGYQYAGDNPIDAIDPSGMEEDSLVGELGGGGAGDECCLVDAGEPGVGDEPPADAARAEVDRVASELKFTKTTQGRMQDPKRAVTREQIAETIVKGSREPDTGGSRGQPSEGAYTYTHDVTVHGKSYKLKVVYNPSTHEVLHFHYYKP